MVEMLIFVLIIVAFYHFFKWIKAGRAPIKNTTPPEYIDVNDYSSVSIQGDGRYRVDVVGESHYQSALESICGGRTEDGVEHYCSTMIRRLW